MAFFEAFSYYPATVTDIRGENEFVKTFTLRVLTPWPYFAGHHCVIRLTDDKGYMAARDYSLSSAPSSDVIEFSVLKESFGEVSTWLHERIRVGDNLEISQPLGEHFIWKPTDQKPVLLIGGGIGIAPLISIVREHRKMNDIMPLSLIYSARNDAQVSFRKDLETTRQHETIVTHITRESTTSEHQKSGRIGAEDLKPLLRGDESIYICGPTAFVNTMELLLHDELGVHPARIKTERFG